MSGSPWGGSESLWFAAAIRLLQAGHKVTVGFKQWGEQESEKLEELRYAGAVVIYWEGSADNFVVSEQQIPKIGWFGRVRNRLWKKRVITNPEHKFLRYIVSLEPDLVFLSQGGTFDVAYNRGFSEFITVQTCPYILMSNSNRDRGFSLDQQTIEQARKCFSRSSQNLFVSKRNFVCAERQIAATIPKAKIVRYPVNLENLTKVESLPVDGQTVMFAQVARLDCRTKGQDILIEILSKAEWRNRNWNLNLYGEGPDRLHLQELARFYGIDNRVHFHGHVKDVRGIWNSNHICLLPSIAEGTPISLLEAMLCGRPAVVSDVGGSAELISDGSSGWVTECASPTSFGRAMERAWSCRDIWGDMGREANKQAHKVRGRDPVAALCIIIESNLHA